METQSKRKNSAPPSAAKDIASLDQTPPVSDQPQTITELKRYCRKNRVPLNQLRFFIGYDYRPPKAFGIYQYGDHFVVYKNKADGTRVVHYDGVSEQYAVRELYHKLLAECRVHGIYLKGAADRSGGKGKAGSEKSGKKKPIAKDSASMVTYVIIGLVALFFFVVLIVTAIQDGGRSASGGRSPSSVVDSTDNSMWYTEDSGDSYDPTDWDSVW